MFKSSLCRGSQIFQKSRSPFSILSGEMKQVLYWGPAVLKWPVNVTVIGCFLLDACELIHIFVSKGKEEWLKMLGTVVQNLVIQHLGFVHPWFYTPPILILYFSICFCYVFAWMSLNWRLPCCGMWCNVAWYICTTFWWEPAWLHYQAIWPDNRGTGSLWSSGTCLPLCDTILQKIQSLL